MKTKTLLAAAMAATFGYAGSASANTVDLFADPAPGDPEYPQEVSLEGATVNIGSTDFNQNTTAYPATILGGYRDLNIEASTDFTKSSDRAFLTAADGILGFSNSADVKTIATVQWDGAENSAVLDIDGLAGANLIDQVGCGSGCAAFLTTVEFADFAFPYTITVYDMDGDPSTLSASSQFSVGTTPQQDVNGPIPADYLFDWFNLATGSYDIAGLKFDITRPGGLIDFTRIGALQLQINAPGGKTAQLFAVDLEIGPIVKVPEPGILGLIGLGGVMVGFARRRSKAKALKA